MTTVMKIQINMRLDSNINTSSSFEHIVSNVEEAKELGYNDKCLLEAWLEGYGSSEAS
jgi:hypothetical protein